MKHSLRLLTLDDIPSALSLCRSAGWNQLDEDWVRLIEYQGEGCFAAEIDGKLIGTVTTTCYGADLAWIGMMLVKADHRRRGVGAELMQKSLDYIRNRGIASVKLDATPLGQSVYETLGFSPEMTFQRWECRHISRESVDCHDRLGETHFALDRRAFAVNRTQWLMRLANDSHVHVTDDGFGMLRRGAIADYVGPLIAESPAVAREIVMQLLRSVESDRVFWDVMNADAAKLATSLGFQPVRDLTRMYFGERTVEPNMTLQYAISDPGTG